PGSRRAPRGGGPRPCRTTRTGTRSASRRSTARAPRTAEQSSCLALHLDELDLPEALEAARGACDLAEAESLVDVDRARVPRGDVKPEAAWAPEPPRVLQLRLDELGAEVAPGEVGPHPEPDFDLVAAGAQVPEAEQPSALAEDGAVAVAERRIDQLPRVVGVRGEVVEVVRRLVLPREHR